MTKTKTKTKTTMTNSARYATLVGARLKKVAKVARTRTHEFDGHTGRITQSMLQRWLSEGTGDDI